MYGRKMEFGAVMHKLRFIIYTDFSTCCNKEKHLVRTLIITLINNKLIFKKTYHKPYLIITKEISRKPKRLESFCKLVLTFFQKSSKMIPTEYNNGYKKSKQLQNI